MVNKIMSWEYFTTPEMKTTVEAVLLENGKWNINVKVFTSVPCHL